MFNINSINNNLNNIFFLIIFIMTRFTKNSSGEYVINKKNYQMLSGTRAQVWHGTAYKTSGGLTKSDLLQNKAGRIVSKSKHSSAKKDNRLVKSGYGTKKGVFGFVKLDVNNRTKKNKSNKKATRKHR
jgi:hypothetical protein